ncbi:MAG: hypothetical protein EOO52_15980 [Gammaproteobacteria bacterium]|nr:MAG: hypothetical protein EOO52_15980 [Gammaproteobacteria bacterium]
MFLLNTGDEYFPVSINTGEEKAFAGENSYVVSPTSTYIDYAQFEVSALKKPLITWPISLLILLIGVALRTARINKLIMINNWLLSTNIYSENFSRYDQNKITSLRDFFTATYPAFALGFRSLNEASNAKELEILRKAGFVSVPTRQLYLFDGRAGSAATFWQKHNTQIDAKALAKMPYELSPGSEFSVQDFQRCEQLYRSLYIEKYCSLNPQYSSHWLAAGQQHGWLNLIGLRNTAGTLEGIVGFFENDQIITAPIVGYNTSLPAKEALYRRLTQICLQRAIAHKKLLNFSSGAAEFKRLRGGVPAIEYTMMYVNHLHFYRRWCWKLLGFLLRKIAVPLMKRWQL